MTENISFYIELNDIELELNIGVGDDERKIKQLIMVSVVAKHNILPESCFNDEIGSGICYHGLSVEVKDFCENIGLNRELKTLEFLGYMLLQNLKIKYNINFNIKICKINPPISFHRKPVSVVFKEFEYD